LIQYNSILCGEKYSDAQADGNEDSELKIGNVSGCCLLYLLPVFFTDFSHPLSLSLSLSLSLYIYIYIYIYIPILILWKPYKLTLLVSLSDSSLLHHYKFKIKKFLQKKIQYIMMSCFHQKGDGNLTTFLMIFLQIIKKYSERFWRSSFNLIFTQKPQLYDKNTLNSSIRKTKFQGHLSTYIIQKR